VLHNVAQLLRRCWGVGWGVTAWILERVLKQPPGPACISAACKHDGGGLRIALKISELPAFLLSWPVPLSGRVLCVVVSFMRSGFLHLAFAWPDKQASVACSLTLSSKKQQQQKEPAGSKKKEAKQQCLPRAGVS
jgi:hypothetical protein